MGISAPLLEVCVPSGIFCWRNIQKVENGEKARGTVAFAQGAKIAEAVSKYDGTVGKRTADAINFYNKCAEKSKILDYTGKAVKWATKNVNPLICASSVVKVGLSDDKPNAIVTETGALAGMFAGEGLMKAEMGKLINPENITKVAQKMENTKPLKSVAKYLLKAGNASNASAVIKGIAFVCGSIASYSVGQKLGEKYSEKVTSLFGYKSPKINQKA